MRKESFWSKVWGSAPHNETGVFGEHLGELSGLSGMDKGDACEVEEEKRKVRAHRHFQALVRKVHLILFKERWHLVVLCRNKKWGLWSQVPWVHTQTVSDPHTQNGSQTPLEGRHWTGSRQHPELKLWTSKIRWQRPLGWGSAEHGPCMRGR